jgi:MFS superfamily sulfate permease-like transporter
MRIPRISHLFAQGTANVFTSVFGGIPATGAIARTVTNIKSGGRTPVAGIIHSATTTRIPESAASQFRETLSELDEHPRILILRMRHVPFIDATGINNLREVIGNYSGTKTKVILSGVQPSLYEDLERARIVFMVGKKNICPEIRSAIQRANEILDPKRAE